ncbi:MAG: SAM-dependent methyltransferase [Gammaproteobacteria bacterium]|nr:SAM-dependent methyltransferase [Gammaproteobacteria bacterium]MCY4255613.1 SAM-dependent methyltransferase [Gammaproteobacteria bacterium]MCY4341606.1 SAM-dependent methyltransferase [Gammaproteobacteria bacterium]
MKTAPLQAPPGHIQAAITKAGGWLAFDRYMELALHHPEEGYYGAGRARFGEDGDFDTAAETSALFGRALAGQCAEILAACPGGDIVELGPGSGRLAEVLLGELKNVGKLPQRYLLVEPSPALRAAQQQRLAGSHPDLAARLEWTDRLARERIRGVILANEVLDALPCKCFRRAQDGWLERGVRLGGATGLEWEDRRAGPALAGALDGLQAELPWILPEGYCSEIRLNLDGFIGGLARSLEAGLALLADYGLPRHELYLAERGQGTLGCHSEQRWHDNPFRRPAQEDITAWVDFTAVRRSAEAAGLAAVGFSSQAQFLIAADILELAGAPPAPEDAAALRRLMLPGGMGEAFKFLGLATAGIKAPSGFAERDLLASLDLGRDPALAAEAAGA